MKNTLYRFSTFVTVLFIIFLIAACSGDLIPITGNTDSGGGNVITLSECYQIRFLGLSRDVTEGSTTWQYQVEELACAEQDLNEWRLEIPACATVLEASPSRWEVIQIDTDLATNEIQWKMDGEFQGGVYMVKLSGALMRGPIQVEVNGSNTTGLIQGPVCDPNAPTPTITFTPGSPTPTATITAIVRVTTSPVGTPTATAVPNLPVTEEPGTSSTKRSPSTPTKTTTSTSTPVPTQTSTPTPEEYLTPASTESTSEPTKETTPTPSGSIPEEISTLDPTDDIPTLASPTETPSEVINITDNDEILTYDCHGGAVTISGNINVVTLVGECSSITVTGNNNRVYWEEGSPVVEDTGSDNSIGQP